MKKINILLALSAVLLVTACSNNPEKETNLYFAGDTAKVKSGGVEIITINSLGKTHNIWTKRIGNNPKTKVLLLNGGPGCTHEYFECFESFLPAEGIEFIYYDQLGCGYSDNPDDTTYWQLDRFVEEVEQVRQALNLSKDNFYLLGHSWGGILAMQYALKYQDNLKGLIISNMMASCPEYGKYADEVLALQLDPKVLETIQQIEANGDFDNPMYMQLLEPNFYAKHICRLPLNEWPEPLNRSFNNTNQSLYVTMQGPSEFALGGNLANWDVENMLTTIKVPSLVIGATHDTMDPKYMEFMANELPNGSFLLCKNGSHMCMYDDQERYFKGLIQFLKG